MRKAIKLLIFGFIMLFFPKQSGHHTNTLSALYKNYDHLIVGPKQITPKISILEINKFIKEIIKHDVPALFWAACGC